VDEETMALVEAIQTWNPDMDEADVFASAEAYLVESRFVGVCAWQLLTYDILEIPRGLPAERSITHEGHLLPRLGEPQEDAKVISMERWLKENGR
jgi:hypothetical protein